MDVIMLFSRNMDTTTS